ncbi:MAG: beta-ketoacyl-[acyl-carrier-protein] synthase family protein [Caldilineaceae bacterium]|nr:beta-ketoacyl-[acyl-carrier-protein] synthase family protein [Caldilineaceae bacterium]MBP8108583.1 beta-ketoacyl-[acyl-carrier-protein] synthase family protein [Caldilineaceae bacterium]
MNNPTQPPIPNPQPPIRVVITGVGMISPLGHDLESSWAGLAAGKSGTGPITHWDASDFPTQICARVNDWEPQAYMDRREARRTGRATQFAWKATREALAMSGLDLEKENKARMGVEMGLAFGGWDIVEEQTLRMAEGGPRRFNPALAPAALISATPTFIAIQLGVTGPANSQVTACATGITALGEAARRVQRGDVDVMIAGGIEGYLSPLIITTFSRLGAGSTRNDDPEHACRPFSGDRDGMVVGEGAAVFVLETLEHAQARGATILAEFGGYGLTEDAYDMTAPDPAGIGAAACMDLALAESGLTPTEMSWIVAHGTATLLNDKMETAAIKRVYGQAAYAIPITSIKSAIGHSMGAAGAQSAAVIVKAMQEGRILPTINYTEPDPDCDLDYVPNVSRAHRVDAGMCNGFGLGGQNASLVLKRFIE